MAKLEVINDSKHEHRTKNDTTIIEFPRKEGIKYCLTCVNECLSDDKLCSCGKDKFLHKNASEILGGYLSQIERLRNYYHKHYNTNSIIKMNNKRIIYYLLIHKHKISIEKKTVDMIYNVNI